jgi:hypothetical protein
MLKCYQMDDLYQLFFSVKRQNCNKGTTKSKLIYTLFRDDYSAIFSFVMPLRLTINIDKVDFEGDLRIGIPVDYTFWVVGFDYRE